MSVTEYDVLSAMQYHGGSFVQALAVAWFRADEENVARLKAAFPELWQEYADLAARTREEFRPWRR